MKKHGLWLLVAALVLLSMVLASCAPAQPQVVTEVVKETVEVEVERVVEVEKPVEVAADVVNIEVWAQANAVEHWRADAPMKAAPLVNEMFEANGDPRRVTVDGQNDSAGCADYNKKLAHVQA